MTYNERNEIINQFLQKLARVAKDNPGVDFKSSDINNWVYGKLYHIGVNINEYNVDLRDKPMPHYHGVVMNNGVGHPESAFNYWINYFRGSNTDVFVQDNWRYFCQFISKDKTAQRSKEHLKVYVPLDASHISMGAQMIFQFLEDNKISHLSKIGKAIRFDDIVIRLTDEKDVNKLINYVTNTPYLMKGLISPNPFAYNKDGVAIAVDGSISYNSTVTGLICLYIDNKKKTNSLDNVNCEDFYKYVNDITVKEFVSNDSTLLQEYFQMDDEREIQNYKQVFSLILKAHNPNFNFNRIVDHYHACKENSIGVSRTKIDMVDAMLLEAIDLMIKRFNNVDAIYNVEAYYLEGAAKYITSRNNLRERMVKSTFREDLHAILRHEGLSFMEYAKKVMQKYRYNPYTAITQTNNLQY